MKINWIANMINHISFTYVSFLSIFTIMVSFISVSRAEGVCPIFDCSDKIADGDPRVGRTCAKYNTTSLTVGVQSCGKDELFCPVDSLNYANVACVQDTFNLFKYNLAPGDFCKNSDQCFKGNSCKDGVCTGKVKDSACEKNKECDVGLYCLNSKCSILQGKGSGVDIGKGQQCVFGSLPRSGICTQLGTINLGEKVPDKESENLCSGFYAQKGTKDTTSFYCGIPPNLIVENFDRPDPNKLDCNYTWYESDTQNKGWKIQLAKCGMNKNNTHICPKYRGEYDFVHQVQDYIKMWNNTFNCHIESNQLYCKDVHDKGYRKLMADWLKDNVETISDDAYAQFADNSECTKNIFNREYWQIMAEINSSYFISVFKTALLFAGIMIFLS